MGLHALLEGEVMATPWFRLRGEALFEQGEGNDPFGLASLVCSPTRRLGAPYLIGSAGIATDGEEGHLAWGPGMGANVDTPGGTPFFLEFRALIEPYGKDHAMATIGVRL